ncbi:oligosaccharide flippase family protein [Mycolicibacterium hodleri]|uniref:oligosaccharide flippase family protein n=1 Tax=Mycolicibacterium hodleri TaxID=49897 RepID=UPI0021F2A424|nr:oligosaccharide flippase family protein [Mycolicibacterium hodleri]
MVTSARRTCDAADMGDSALTAADVAPVVSENARPAAKSANFGKQSAWNYAVFAVSKSSTLLMTVVVARLLDPAEFGIFALALLLVNLFDYVKDLGVAAALVQSPRPWNRIAPTGLTLSVAFGVAFGVLLAIAADSTADLLHHPELGPLIRVLAIALTISAFSVVPLSRLRRDLSFQSRLLPEFSGAIVKTALTIGLAATHHGVWSLVYGQLAGVVVTTVLYWRAAPASVRPHFDRAEARALLRFGIPVTGVTLLAYGIYNVDYLAVGTRLGTTELGLYTLAYRVPELVVLNLCTVISEVLFSSLSRLQHDRKALSAHYRQTLGVVVALTAPIGIGLAAIAKPLLETMYGARYAAAGDILVVLSVYTVVYSASFHAGDVLKAVGRPGLLTAINGAKLVVLVGPIWWAAGHSATLVAVALLVVEVLHFGIRMTLVRRVIPLGWMELCSLIGRPLGAAIPMGLALVAVDTLLTHVPSTLRICVLVPLGGLVYAVGLHLTAPHLTRTAVRYVHARSMKPGRIVMNRTPRLWLRPIVAIAAVIGVLIGGAVGMLVPLTTHYRATAQVAMVPGANLTTADASAYWEVLTQGQVSHTAATVFSDPRWTPSAVSAAGVDASEITLTAGAIPNTTMVSITADGPSAHAVQAALSDLLDKALPEVTAVSTPFTVRIVSQPVSVTATAVPRLQIELAGALGGLVLGAVVGLGLAWLRGRTTRGDSGATDMAHQTDHTAAAP